MIEGWYKTRKYEGCTECAEPKHYALGYCKTHYNLNRLNGFPGYVVKEPKFCECGKKALSRGMCKACYQSWYYYNQQNGPVDTSHHRYKEHPAYVTMHFRIRRERGRAHEYECVLCGKQADNWALRADAQNLLTQPEGRYKGTVYSADPYAYWPMCQADHKAYDATVGHRKGRGGRRKQTT